MGSATRTTPGQTDVTITGKHNFAVELWSGGGTGADAASNTGGGGGLYVAATIPDANLVGETQLSLITGANGTAAQKGGHGQLYAPTLTQGIIANGGNGGAYSPYYGVGATDYSNGLSATITANHSGGNAGAYDGACGGGGGGSAGVTIDGNPGTQANDPAGGIGGAAVTGGGAGGDGGGTGQNGQAGGLPGGGGGGGGSGGTGGVGGNAKAILTWDDITTPVISSNGGGATANINLPENQEDVTTGTVSAGTEPITWSISGGADAARFLVDSVLGNVIADPAFDFENLPHANPFVFILRAANGINLDTYDEQTISVTVTDVAEGGGGAASRSFSLGRRNN